jgi:hypothetical protein
VGKYPRFRAIVKGTVVKSTVVCAVHAACTVAFGPVQGRLLAGLVVNGLSQCRNVSLKQCLARLVKAIRSSASHSTPIEVRS